MAVDYMLFDAFGTIFTLESLWRGYEALAALARERLGLRGLDASGYAAVLDRLWSAGRPSFALGLVEASGGRVGLGEALRLVLEALPPRLEAHGDAVEALRLARRLYRGVAVVSDGDPEVVEAALGALGLGGLVDVVVGSRAVGEAKPSPRPVVEALRLLGAPGPGAAGMVGDSWKDVAAARAAGLGFAGLVVRRPLALRGHAPDAAACRLDELVRLARRWGGR